MNSGPRVLMLSLSRELAADPSRALNDDQVRQLAYAELCDSVDIVVKTPREEAYQFRRLNDRLRVHAVNSANRIVAAVRMWQRGARLARSRRPDVIVVQDPFVLGVVGWILARRTGAALCVHVVCDLIDNPHWLRERFEHRLLNAVAKFVLRRATVIRVDNRQERDKLFRLGLPSERIHYIPFLQDNLSDFAMASAAMPAVREGADRVVLFAARLEWQKGLDTLVEVIRAVSSRRPGVRFEILGDGGQRRWFERQLESAGLMRVVRMRGWRPVSELPAYFQSSDAFLLTSRYETSARVLVLARTAGLPIVTTDVSGAREVIGPNDGGVANVGDAADLARLLIQVLDRPVELRDRSATSAPEFSRDDIIDGFARMLGAAQAAASVVSDTGIAYVLPKYDPHTEEHFLHTYQLLSEMSASADLSIIVERSTTVPTFGSAHVMRQQFTRWPPLRVLEMLVLMLRVRARGVKTFYIHYSNVAVLAAWIVTRVFGGRVCYWHCVSKFFRTPGWAAAAIRHRLTAELPIRLTMRLIDVLVTGTPSLAEMYRARFQLADVRVVPNEIDPSRFAPGTHVPGALRAELRLGPSDRVVLFVHRLAPRKGALRLPALAARLAAFASDVRMVIVGDGPSAAAVQAIVGERAELAHMVRFTGWVPNSEIPRYYALADVLIMPSEEEGFPRVLLEAMAAGVPFVATDVGGVRDLCDVAQQWGVVSPQDEDAFAKRVLALLNDAERRRSLAEVGLRHVQRYRVGSVAEETLEQLDIDRTGYAVAGKPRATVISARP